MSRLSEIEREIDELEARKSELREEIAEIDDRLRRLELAGGLLEYAEDRREYHAHVL